MTEYQIITKEGQCTTVKADDFEIDKDKHTIKDYKIFKEMKEQGII